MAVRMRERFTTRTSSTRRRLVLRAGFRPVLGEGDAGDDDAALSLEFTSSTRFLTVVLNHSALA
ncbi:hypothetical protein ASF83_14500 [Plantibacter sp. Leaf171]|nr:hypothetical protein ASE44_14510 [Plantibacter sp. Leaf1]KQR57407.1 hypothetical protein ASF83_14500 [Plantibacter sp. Leaf171]